MAGERRGKSRKDRKTQGGLVEGQNSLLWLARTNPDSHGKETVPWNGFILSAHFQHSSVLRRNSDRSRCHGK